MMWGYDDIKDWDLTEGQVMQNMKSVVENNQFVPMANVFLLFCDW